MPTWIKVKEQKFDKPKLIRFRLLGTADEWDFGKRWPAEIAFLSRKESGLEIEYLDETDPSQLPLREGEDYVNFLDWFLLTYMNKKGATSNSSGIVVEKYLEHLKTKL